MKKIPLIFFFSLFTFFVILLLAQSQGYYKTRSQKAKTLTDEQIINFEKDVREGRDIDVKKYVLYEDKDYTNNVSDNIYRMSLKLENVVDGAIRLIFNGASKAVND